MDFVRYGLVAAGVIAVLALTYRGLGAYARKRVARDFKDPDEILEAVRVYEAYGRHDAAVELLRGGVERHPENEALAERLSALESEPGGRG